MRWIVSLSIGVLTAVSALVLAGWVAALAVDWYAISSFEGGAGFFVVGIALLGAFAGFVIGVVASRVVAARAKRPGFWKGLAAAHAVTIGLAVAIGAAARLLADVPPRIAGEELFLAVEIRWPQGSSPAEPADASDWRLRLSSSVGRTVRASSGGPLWREDARREDGRWVVPGAVDLFTSRGDRVLDVEPDGVIDHGFLVPLPGFPGREYLEWSDWLPHARSGEEPLPDGFRYRFRLVPRNQPIRVESFGPFEVATVATGFGEYSYGDAPSTWTAYARFLVRHHDQPVAIPDPDVAALLDDGETHFDGVAALPGPVPALLARAVTIDMDGACYLLASEPEGLRVARVGPCDGTLRPAPLTADNAVFTNALESNRPAGRFDRTSYLPGLYWFDGALLDTRTLTIRAYPPPEQPHLIGRIPPLGVSPDGESFVRLEWAEGSDGQVALGITDVGSGECYRLAVDQKRMRYLDIDQIDPAWVLHHFEWHHGPGAKDRMVERVDFTPLPYRGRLSNDGTGYREYRVAPAQEALRSALIDFLVAEFEGERLPAEADDYAHEVRIDDAIVNVTYDDGDHHVGVWMERGTDSAMVAAIAERFDAALATGRYDGRFEP